MTEGRENRLNSLPDPAGSPEGDRPGPNESINRENYPPKYDPRVPDEVALHEREKENPEYLNTPEGRAEAAESSRGEELRPKDGTLDPSSSR